MKKKVLSTLAAFLLVMSMAITANAAEALPEGTANLDYSFVDLDGAVRSSQAEGKPKMLVFFKIGCPNCENTLSTISTSEWLQNGEVDVYAVECQRATADAVKGFKDNYCSAAGDKIKFGTDPRSMTQAELYIQAAGANSFSKTPLIVMIDANNNLCFVMQGQLLADEFEANYLPSLKSSTDSGSGDSETDDSETDDSQQPGDSSGSSSQTKPENKKDKDKSKNTRDKRSSSCNHVGEYVTVNDATSSSDALSAYQCTKCGEVLRYEAVPNSAYATFLADAANTILHAQQSEVTINTTIWTSFNRAVFEALRSRADVAVTVNYSYKGKPYVLHIPAGADVDSLMDENGFAGFMYIEKVLNSGQ